MPPQALAWGDNRRNKRVAKRELISRSRAALKVASKRSILHWAVLSGRRPGDLSIVLVLLVLLGLRDVPCVVALTGLLVGWAPVTSSELLRSAHANSTPASASTPFFFQAQLLG
jgi:hypothetical protein